MEHNIEPCVPRCFFDLAPGQGVSGLLDGPAGAVHRVLGAGLGIWGAINLMEGYGNDNPGAKSQGMKQLMAK